MHFTSLFNPNKLTQKVTQRNHMVSNTDHMKCFSIQRNTALIVGALLMNIKSKSTGFVQIPLEKYMS